MYKNVKWSGINRSRRPGLGLRSSGRPGKVRQIVVDGQPVDERMMWESRHRAIVRGLYGLSDFIRDMGRTKALNQDFVVPPLLEEMALAYDRDHPDQCNEASLMFGTPDAEMIRKFKNAKHERPHAPDLCRPTVV